MNMNKQIIRDFAEAINEHNVDNICSLMTEDHAFIDSQGNEVVGKEKMRAGWIGYFQLFPDYRIEITNVFHTGEFIAAFGFAEGTYKGLIDDQENHWRLPAAWRAVVRNERIQLWQVYADSKIPFDIITKNKNH
jgi:ketosteroid isomerase-like protein